MKKLHYLRTILFIFMILSQLIGSVSAVEFENYDTSPTSLEEQTAFLEKINFRLLDNKEEDHAFSHFAISEQGQIALGFNTGSDAIIYIYDSNGQFLYGYCFLNNKCALTIFFEQEDLSIFWGKSNYIGSFDSSGTCLQFRKVINSERSNNSYNRDRYRPLSGKVGDIQYAVKRGMGLASNYVRFIIEDSDGNSRIIYNAEKEYHTQIAFYCLLCVIAFLSTIGIIRHNRIIKKKKSE